MFDWGRGRCRTASKSKGLQGSQCFWPQGHSCPQCKCNKDLDQLRIHKIGPQPKAVAPFPGGYGFQVIMRNTFQEQLKSCVGRENSSAEACV